MTGWCHGNDGVVQHPPSFPRRRESRGGGMTECVRGKDGESGGDDEKSVRELHENHIASRNEVRHCLSKRRTTFSNRFAVGRFVT